MKTTILIIYMMMFSVLGFSQNEVLFKKATEVYNEGDYVKAIDYYEQILQSGKHSAELYYNMGNAYYKLNQTAPSIYYYEKALLLSPEDAEIKNNLRFAQNMRLDAIEEMPKTVMENLYESTAAQLSSDYWAIIAIVLIFLFVSMYLAYFFVSSANYKRAAFISSIASLFLALLVLVFAYLQYEEYKNDNPAIVFSREVRVLAEPNKRAQEVFTLHEGTKLNVLEKLEGWQKVKIADGQTGWLTSDDIKLLKDF